MKKFIYFFIIILLSIIFFKPLFVDGKLPIPTDTIVGLYYPYRDFYAKAYPRGIPFKNFMITDPVRQQYPWKNLSIELEKNFKLPLWNPYTFAGAPLLGNMQSGAFYPLNILFFLLSFPLAWSLLIFFQPLLASLFLFLYLDNLKLDKKASLLGAIAFAFGGFSISWLEWGSIISTALWLPLILLSIDKILFYSIDKSKKLNKNLILYFALLIFSLCSSFFAGHLQIFFYISVFSVIYLMSKIFYQKEKKMLFFWFGLAFIIFILLTLAQWLPGLEFIKLSARNLDQDYRTIAGWFIPWQNAIQILIPDFFGNPATLNYRGVFNYGEFISYIGIGALIFSLFSIFRKDKKTLFFFSAVLISIIFAFPTIIAKIPYKFSFPLISTSQPTRLVFIIDFSLSVLAALGFDYFLKTEKKKGIYFVLGFLVFIFAAVWAYSFIILKNVSLAGFLVTKQNLIFPTILLVINIAAILVFLIFIKRNKNKERIKIIFSAIFIIILFADLLRFGWKYDTFADKKYLYPQTKILSFLIKNAGNYRIMSTDSSIFPPNFSVMYKLQTLDGYDPLYLDRYAELIAAINRGSADIHPPFGFNRIITPQHTESRIMDLLGVKYILSPTVLTNLRFKEVLREGNTIVYQNNDVLPRAFFVETVHKFNTKQKSINYLFDHINELRTNATVENGDNLKPEWAWGASSAEILRYNENSVDIQTKAKEEGFLVLTDSFYPTWHATIDGKETKIYLTDYNFRGIVVPSGNHKVEFYDSLF